MCTRVFWSGQQRGQGMFAHHGLAGQRRSGAVGGARGHEAGGGRRGLGVTIRRRGAEHVGLRHHRRRETARAWPRTCCTWAPRASRRRAARALSRTCCGHSGSWITARRWTRQSRRCMTCAWCRLRHEARESAAISSWRTPVAIGDRGADRRESSACTTPPSTRWWQNDPPFDEQLEHLRHHRALRRRPAAARRNRVHRPLCVRGLIPALSSRAGGTHRGHRRGVNTAGNRPVPARRAHEDFGDEPRPEGPPAIDLTNLTFYFWSHSSPSLILAELWPSTCGPAPRSARWIPASLGPGR